MNNFAVVMLVIVVASAVAVGVFYVYYLEPAQQEVSNLEVKISKNLKEIENLKRVDEDIAKEKARIETLEKKKRELETESIKLESVVPKLLDSTELIASKFEVKFQDIRISPLTRSENWSELPVEMTAIGTFQQIGNFLKVLENRKIINLASRGSINVAVTAEPDPKSKSPLLTVTINGRVFIMGSGQY